MREYKTEEQKNIGIYYIKNKINNKVYVGQSKNINARLKEHRRDLKANRHVNWHLQKSFEKYGESNFEYGVLEYCSIELLNEKEIKHIKTIGSIDRHKGYNLKDGGNRTIFSQETLVKMFKTRKEMCEDESCLIQMCWARSELLEEQVRNIKTMLFNDIAVKDIANKINITYHQVRHIKDNNSFTFILPEYNFYIKHREDIYRKRNNRKIIRMYREGYSFKEMSMILNVNAITPYRIAKDIVTSHDERCRNNAIAKSYKKRNSLVWTLSGMGYSAVKISKSLKIAKNVVYAILHDTYKPTNVSRKIETDRYKEAKVMC